MIAALYARKSQKKEEAIERQVTLAREFANARGWTVADVNVYQDDGVSGAAFFEHRPGFQALQHGAKAGRFDVVVTMALDRLGRESIRTATALLDLVEAGVRVFYYNDGSELTLDTPVSKAMLSLQGFGAEDYRYQVKMKTREALRAKAKAGHVACSKVFGYDNVNGKRVENEAEAQVVRRIFDLAATQGLLKTTREVKKPVTTIRRMLDSRVYLVEETYGRTRWVDKGGTRMKQATPESEWILVKVPAIITQAQWDAAHARLHATRQKHTGVRDEKGQLHGSIARDSHLDSRHLLSGFLKCAACGGGMSLQVTVHKSGKPWKGWICTRRYRQGRSTLEGCWGSVPYDAITQAVRGALDPKAIEAEVIAYLKTSVAPGPEDQRDRIAADLAKAEKEEQSSADAIGLGGDLPVLVAKLKGGFNPL